MEIRLCIAELRLQHKVDLLLLGSHHPSQQDVTCQHAGPERSQLKGIDHDCNDIPDAAMTLAVAALFAQGQTRIRNVYNWRVKVCPAPASISLCLI